MEQYLIDTNAVSHYLSGQLSDAGNEFMDHIIDATPNLLIISQIELLSWITPKQAILQEFIDDSLVYNLTPEIVATCIKIRRERKIKTPDAIIAATAISHDLTLISDNVRDFAGIPGLKLSNLKDLT
jgi:predicted nucleic acid-binding protein